MVCVSCATAPLVIRRASTAPLASAAYPEAIGKILCYFSLWPGIRAPPSGIDRSRAEYPFGRDVTHPRTPLEALKEVVRWAHRHLMPRFCGCYPSRPQPGFDLTRPTRLS